MTVGGREACRRAEIIIGAGRMAKAAAKLDRTFITNTTQEDSGVSDRASGI